MSEYHMDEALFELPPGWTDQSVHTLTRPIDGTAERLSISVIRDDAPHGRSLSAYVDRNLAMQKHKLSGFELLDRDDQVDLGGLGAISARIRWRAPSGPVYHRHVFLLLHGRVVAFVGTCRHAHRDLCDDELDAVLSSLRFREARA
ncbi:MAG: DcrB-related protein [Polyangiaceae bacterium]|nr:DcrB-related protein [Polyangiaceae bacterium]